MIFPFYTRQGKLIGISGRALNNNKLRYLTLKFDETVPLIYGLRTVDYNKQVLNFEYKNLDITLPHIELTSRNFVLFPLKEIFPEWKHPKTKEIIDVLIQKLSEENKKSILKIKKN